MAEIIEQENVEQLFGGSLVAFQTSDLKALAAKILRRANEVAQQKIAAAAQTAAAQEKKAYDTGLAKGTADGEKKGEAAGRAAGEKTARDEFAKSVTGVSAALKTCVDELNRRKMQLQADAEADMLHLAVAIAQRIVRQEMSVNPEAILPVVREAVSLCNNRSDLTLRLNPADIEVVEKEIPALQGVFTDLGRVDIVGDANIERGGALLQNRSSAVDLRLAQQFAALERALAGSVNSPFANLPKVDTLTAEESAIAGAVPFRPAENVPVAPAAAAERSEPPAAVNPPSRPAEQPETPQAVLPDNPVPASVPASPQTLAPETTVADSAPSAQETVSSAVSASAISQPATAQAAPAAPVKPAGLSGFRNLNDLAHDPKVEAAISAALGAK